MEAIRSNSIAQRFWQWALKRGILYGLISTPTISLLISYFFRWIDFPTATAFTVILAFAVLPVWVLYRKSRSDDPDEPVHHLPQYALYALVPYIVYNLSRIPMHFLLQIVFWDHWYDFGNALTGQPVDQYSSLIPGTLLHSLQGYTLALGFYILYKRHTFANALAYVFVFLSTVYAWTFPTFVLVDYQPPLKWFFVVYWAHFWMALAAWYVPKFLYSPTLWNRLKGRLAKGIAIAVIVLIYLIPFAFVFARVETWQFPTQHAIDQATFSQVKLVLQNPPALNSLEPVPGQPGLQEVHYQFSLRFGPRPYRDYINALKALDAGPVRVTGWVMYQGDIIAWCSTYVPELPTPNKLTNPLQYFPVVQRMEFTDIPVQCVGNLVAARNLAAQPKREVDLQWTATVTLIGDREQQEQTFQGTYKATSLEINEPALKAMAQGR